MEMYVNGIGFETKCGWPNANGAMMAEWNRLVKNSFQKTICLNRNRLKHKRKKIESYVRNREKSTWI